MMSNNSIYDHMLTIIKEPNNKTKSELKEALLLVKFYNNPESVLGDKNSPTPERYTKITNYNTLFLNNNFTLLIKEGLEKDECFGDKLDFQLLRKLSLFLYDGIECKKKYVPNVRDEYKKAAIEFNRIAKDKNIDNRTYYKAFSNAYHLSEKLKYSKYSQKKVDRFDATLAEQTCTEVDNLLKCVYEATEGLTKEKRLYLSLIKKEKYVDDYNEKNLLEVCTVDSRLGYNKNFVLSVVLENKFLDIISKFIQKNNVNMIMIRNTIRIIELGIRIRKFQLYDYETSFLNLFDKETIRNFDVKRAEMLLSKLTLLRVSLSSKTKEKRLTLVKNKK